MAQRGRVSRFLSGTEDADKLSGMAEDIRDALIEYQVRQQRDCSHLG